MNAHPHACNRQTGRCPGVRDVFCTSGVESCKKKKKLYKSSASVFYASPVNNIMLCLVNCFVSLFCFRCFVSVCFYSVVLFRVFSVVCSLCSPVVFVPLFFQWVFRCFVVVVCFRVFLFRCFLYRWFSLCAGGQNFLLGASRRGVYICVVCEGFFKW